MVRNKLLEDSVDEYWTLIEQNSFTLRNYARKVTHNYHDGEDLYFTAVLSGIGTFVNKDPQIPFLAWMFRVIKNNYLYQSREEHIKTRSMEFVDQKYLSIKDEVKDLDNHRREAYDNEQLDQLRDLLGTSNYEAFYLRIFGGHTDKEIAEKLGITRENARVRLYRGRKILKHLLA